MLYTSVVLLWPNFMLRCASSLRTFMICCTCLYLLLYFGEQASCYVVHFCCTSVTNLHVTLHTSVVLRWTNFMLRFTLLLCFGEHTSCYVAHFCCTLVNKLHVTLYTSVVLLWPTFILRCTLLLYFCDETSCYVAHFCWTSVNTLHVMLHTSSVNTLDVTLHTSVVHRWTHFMLRCTLLLYFGDQTSCYVAHLRCTSVTKDCAPCPARQPKGACPYWCNR